MTSTQTLEWNVEGVENLFFLVLLMGIYPERGVQYEAETTDGVVIVVASVRDVDERLLNSNYLEKLGGINPTSANTIRQ